AVVAMIDDQVKQTRCTTCDADHEYKQARVPPPRRKKDSNLPDETSEETPPVDEVAADAEAAEAEAAAVEAQPADAGDETPAEDRARTRHRAASGRTAIVRGPPAVSAAADVPRASSAVPDGSADVERFHRQARSHRRRREQTVVVMGNRAGNGQPRRASRADL